MPIREPFIDKCMMNETTNEMRYNPVTGEWVIYSITQAGQTGRDAAPNRVWFASLQL